MLGKPHTFSERAGFFPLLIFLSSSYFSASFACVCVSERNWWFTIHTRMLLRRNWYVHNWCVCLCLVSVLCVYLLRVCVYVLLCLCIRHSGIFVQDFLCVSPCSGNMRTQMHAHEPVFNFNFSSYQCQILNMLHVLNGCNGIHVLRWVTFSTLLMVSDHIYVRYSAHGLFICITMCYNVMLCVRHLTSSCRTQDITHC